ncbi:hypothetical protein SETIT_5G019400v2 [Setaria italica]|uniref:Uncharacterized protein n=1 Tax=Setaria italica TaxID=4555 RepID=A0A368R076_SETIT|nr:hypothetical protein SETIT_5G019400v2 [Setaria italica]
MVTSGSARAVKLTATHLWWSSAAVTERSDLDLEPGNQHQDVRSDLVTDFCFEGCGCEKCGFLKLIHGP